MTDESTLIDASVYPRLIVEVKGQIVQEAILRDELSIGRAEDNDIDLMDAKVSRHHARIHRQGANFILTDLGSANGTLVNGQRLTRPHTLQHGERIGIGNAELLYQELGESADETVIAPTPSTATQATATQATIPSRPAVVPPPPARGAGRGLVIGLVLVAAVTLIAMAAITVYLLNPQVFQDLGLIAEPTQTPRIVVATTVAPTATETPTETSVETPATTPVVPVLEPTSVPADDTEGLLTQAEALTHRSKFEEAITIYQNLVDQAPDDARPEIGWAWALILDDQAPEALAHAQRAVELAADDAEAAAMLARAYIEIGDKNQALSEAQRAIQLDPGNATAQAVLAEAYMVNGQNQEAVDAADLALVQDINNADAHRIRAWLYHIVDNDMGRAAGELQVAAGLQPELWLRRHELGVLLLEAEDYTTAIMAFQDALGIRPKATTYAAIGEAYYQLGQYDQARASLQQAISTGAENVDTYALLAATYAYQDRCDDAQTYIDLALGLEPTHLLATEAKEICEGARPSPTASPTTVSASNPTATPESGPTPQPTRRPSPPASVSGRIAFPVWNPETHQYDVYVARAKDGSGRHIVVSEMHQPAFSPNGEWLAVNGARHDQMNLFIVRPDGSNLKKITDFREDNHPYWSPDSKSLALATTRDQPGHPKRVYIIDEVPFLGRSEKGRALALSNGWQVWGECPTWSPDGQIIYKGCDNTIEPQECGLFSIPAFGGNFKKLTNKSEDTAPAAYGNKIAFMSNRQGNWEIYIINNDGSGLKRLTNNASNDGLPTWSPNGKTLAFVSNQGGPWAVWAMSPDGSNRRKLFDIGGGGLASDWQSEQIGWGP
jgi:tetratricopeptide (TPR) repeat protein